MVASSTWQDLGRLALLVSLGLALLRVRWLAQPGVHLLATSVVQLQALCRAAGGLARSWPPPKTISIDVSPIVTALDATSVETLVRACRRWRRAGIAVRIDGCDPRLSAALTRHGLDAALQGSELASGVECPRLARSAEQQG